MISKFVKSLFEEHKAARRITLFWALWLISVVTLRVTDPEVIPTLTAASATVITAIIGILTTVIGFYQWHRNKDTTSDKDNKE
jgi:hypothetical protein